MKKLSLVGLLVGLLMVLGACGSPPNQSTSSAGGESAEEAGSSASAPTQASNGSAGGDVEVDVTSVQRPFISNNQFVTPNAGNEFLLLGVTITNNTQREARISAMEFSLKDASGVQRDAEIMGSSEIPDHISSVTLSPGASTSGSLLMQAPIGSNPLTLVYKPMGMGQGSEVKLS